MIISLHWNQFSFYTVCEKIVTAAILLEQVKLKISWKICISAERMPDKYGGKKRCIRKKNCISKKNKINKIIFRVANEGPVITSVYREGAGFAQFRVFLIQIIRIFRVISDGSTGTLVLLSAIKWLFCAKLLHQCTVFETCFEKKEKKNPRAFSFESSVQ